MRQPIHTFLQQKLKQITAIVATVIVYVVVFSMFTSCQKDLALNSDIGAIKQVVIANLYPDAKLTVNISRSKSPNDFNSINFLQNCKVDAYEDGVFMETLPFILKDTLSGLGYYTSSFKLQQGKTYKIVSSHPELGIVEATEYMPRIPTSAQVTLLQHADSTQPNKQGQYMLMIQDSALFKNYYFLATYYRILKPTINNVGDTVYKYDYIGYPSYSPTIPNPGNANWSFFTDANFDGQFTSFSVNFQSLYNNIYKEILLVVELAACGKNFYDWNTQQIRLGNDYLNDGQLERINLEGNIINGYGHFTANSSIYIGIPIK
jgi:hypothetical protein